MKRPWWVRTLEGQVNGAVTIFAFWLVAHVLFHVSDHTALYILAWLIGTNTYAARD